MTALVPTSNDYEWVQQTHDYSNQILRADSLSLALMAGGEILAQNAMDEGKSTKFGESLGTAGFGSYLLAPAVIHKIRGNGKRARGSFGLRIGLPLVVGMAVAETARHSSTC